MARKTVGPPETVSPHLEENLDFFTEKLGIGISIDVLVKGLTIGGKKGALVFIDGFTNGDVVTLILQNLTQLNREDIFPDPFTKLTRVKIPYLEIETSDQLSELMDQMLVGQMIIFLDGEKEAIIMDVREFPVRGPEEPDTERLTRGSRDGFVETLMFNIALTRRRVRDPGLRVEAIKAGRRSKTDVAILYINDIADPELVEEVKTRLDNIDIDGLPMAEKSIEEFIVEGRWSIFPLVRYTERPDVAAMHLYEGHVIMMVDTSPAAIIAPATFFHHVQHAEEYRQSILSGVYVRWIRFLGIFISMFLAPLYLLVSLHPELLPEMLDFIGPEEVGNVPLFIQFIIVHLGIDLIRMAGVHTPDPLATAMGLIAALLIGEIAIEVGIFTPEVLLYGGLTAVGMFSTPSYELSLSNRLVHLFMLVVTGLFRLPGFIGGLVIIFIRLATNKSFGVPYLWPLLPFNMKALWSIIMRRPVPIHEKRPSILKTQDEDRITTEEGGKQIGNEKKGRKKKK
ncbi:spore germination protein [Dethiobacter alkaliphilus]|uniref:spore germination protein n=1 Tax=Dethiobacter alkaliphilus TaxID=427926 RepID=UPI0022269451|nr:spore germination protein [Dethiobacter alkaliphilus]MCW3491452.1 spore germination protein [Dethiobacter alkaliphilus]